MALGPRPAPRAKRPIYESLIRPNEKKIIWYRKLPQVSPAVKVGDSDEPRGALKSPNTLIALSPKPKSTQQVVLQAAPEIKLEHDIVSPNLIGVRTPLPTAPPAKVLKKFAAPAPPPKVQAPALLEPDVTLTWTDTGGALRSLTTMRPKREFVAPPKPDASTSAHPVVLESAPELGHEGAAQVAKLPGPGVGSKTPAKRFVPPSGTGTDGSASGTTGPGTPGLDIPPQLATTANMSGAIIGLRPSDRIEGAIPPGSRSGEFSSAPNVGKPATGNVNGSGGVTIPGLVIRDGKNLPGSEARTEAPAGSRIRRYDDLVSEAVRPALSAPLRPSSRTIPMSLESRFRGRLVFTIVIPAPNLPAYTGDWIVWFTESAQRATGNPRMRAPVPLQKTELQADARPAPADHSEVRIQLAATIRSNGQFDSVSLVKGPPTAASRVAIEDMKRWLFKPALLDGAPIDVEVVIEIPFSLAWLNGSS